MKTPYPVILFFTKAFKRGFHKGSSLSETLPFVSRDSAKAWLDGVAANFKRGNVEYVVSDPFILNAEPYKGFVMWANDEKSAFFWTNGKDVYRSPVSNVPDTGGFVSGRWESGVTHWNHYAETYKRPRIE